jgi:hypothetical protein
MYPNTQHGFHNDTTPPLRRSGGEARVVACARLVQAIPRVRIRDCNWMKVEEYLRRDDRAVLPLGSTEQHSYLSLSVDSILSEQVAVEAAEAARHSRLPRDAVWADAVLHGRIRERSRCAFKTTLLS